MIRGYPFDNNDYSAADVAASFADLMTNGVNIYGNSDALKVTQGAGLSVNIANGTGRINGRMFKVDSQTLPVTAGSAIARIDRVVVRLDAESAQNFSIYVKQGTSAPPSLERNTSGTIHEISLATLTVVNSTITINDDRADGTLCGFVSFMGNPPYYPNNVIPQNMWTYAVFPGDLTSTQKQEIENNPSLMAKWLASPIALNTISFGAYTGNGAASRKITLSKTPRFVLVLQSGSRITYNSYYFGGLAVTGNPAVDVNNANRKIVEVTSDGFNVFFDGAGIASNENGMNYTYLWG